MVVTSRWPRSMSTSEGRFEFGEIAAAYRLFDAKPGALLTFTGLISGQPALPVDVLPR